MPEQPAETSDRPAWRILHVDDDEDDFFITREMLRQARGRTIFLEWASSYQEGRSLLESNTYDAVLIDYDLGQQNGIDFIRETVAGGFHPPLILYTGRGTYEADLEALQAGATLYITKSEVNPLLLVRSIRYAIERLKLEQERAYIIDSITDGLFALDRNWKFIFLNRSAAGIVGAQPEDLVGKNLWESYPALLGTTFEHNYRKAMLERVPVKFEIQGIQQDKWYDINVYPFHEGISIYWQDVTEKRRAKEALLEREARFRAVFEWAEIGIAISDLQGRIVESNPALERMLGYTGDELQQMTFADYTMPQDLEVEWGLVEELIAGKRDHYELQKKYIRKNGVVFPVRLIGSVVRNANGDPALGIALVEDITERLGAEQAQHELAESLELDRSRLAAILENLPVGIWIGDRDGQLIGKNQQADRIWSGEAPLVGKIQEYTQYQAWNAESGAPLPPEDYPMAKAVLTGQPVEPVELNILRLDGTPGTVLVSAAPVIDSQSQLIGVVGVNVDITGRKQMEADLRLSEELFSKAFNATPNAMSISRMDDGRIYRVNERFLELFGYQQDDVIGKTSSQLKMFANPAQRDDAVAQLKADNRLQGYDIDICLRSGEIRPIQLWVELLTIAGEPFLLTILGNPTSDESTRQAPNPRASSLQ